MNKCNSLKTWCEATDTYEPKCINHIIKTKYDYLLIISEGKKILVDVGKQYDSVLINENGYLVIVININNMFFYNAINFDNGDDVLGFSDYRTAISNCDDSTTIACNQPNSKLIFSPQLANYLLDAGFKIIHLKENIKTKETIFVFQVEQGFGDILNQYKKGL